MLRKKVDLNAVYIDLWKILFFKLSQKIKILSFLYYYENKMLILLLEIIELRKLILFRLSKLFF